MTEYRRQASSPQARLAESADHLTDSATQQTDSADRRTQLAADRTVLAAERTYAAWVRTGLAALASGVGARALLKGLVPNGLGLVTASVLMIFAAFCFLAGVWREMIRIAPVAPDTPRLPARLLIFVNAFLLLVCLAALIGIWLA
jgi:putative membrane protein